MLGPFSFAPEFSISAAVLFFLLLRSFFSTGATVSTEVTAMCSFFPNPFLRAQIVRFKIRQKETNPIPMIAQVNSESPRGPDSSGSVTSMSLVTGSPALAAAAAAASASR